MKAIATNCAMYDKREVQAREDLLSSKEYQASESDKLCVCSKRWILAYLGFVFGTNFGLYRINMSMAVVCMVKDENTSGDVGDHVNVNNVTDFTKQAEFTWDKQTQSVVLSAFFYGFMVSQIPGGWLVGRYGGKRIITACTAASSVITVLIPTLARLHIAGVICARTLIGIFSGPLLPAWFSLVGRWTLPNERGRVMMLFWTGQTAGSVLGITTSGMLCIHGFDNGWGSIFYTHGISGLAFIVLWVCLAADSPNTHPTISTEEKRLIAHHLRTPIETKTEINRVPWLKVLSSSTVWSVFITQLCDNWQYYLILTCLPLFVTEALKFDVQSNGVYSSLPLISTTLSMLSSGVLADAVNKKRWMSRTATRKLFQITSLLGSALFLVLSAYLPHDRPSLVILCMCVCTFFQYIALSSGYPCNIIDMSPRYAGYLYGISNTIGASSGVLAPIVVGILTKHKTIDEWRLVFWISAGIAGFGALTYGLFTSSELLPWDPEYTKTIEITLEEEPLKSDTAHEMKTDLETNKLSLNHRVPNKEDLI